MNIQTNCALVLVKGPIVQHVIERNLDKSALYLYNYKLISCYFDRHTGGKHTKQRRQKVIINVNCISFGLFSEN